LDFGGNHTRRLSLSEHNFMDHSANDCLLQHSGKEKACMLYIATSTVASSCTDNKEIHMPYRRSYFDMMKDSTKTFIHKSAIFQEYVHECVHNQTTTLFCHTANTGSQHRMRCPPQRNGLILAGSTWKWWFILCFVCVSLGTILGATLLDLQDCWWKQR
jgi:hypothetical protein